jgi:hypothetical protein
LQGEGNCVAYSQAIDFHLDDLFLSLSIDCNQLRGSRFSNLAAKQIGIEHSPGGVLTFRLAP